MIVRFPRGVLHNPVTRFAKRIVGRYSKAIAGALASLVAVPVALAATSKLGVSVPVSFVRQILAAAFLAVINSAVVAKAPANKPTVGKP